MGELEAVLQRTWCFYQNHSPALSLCLSSTCLARDKDATFADVLQGVEECHKATCGCQRYPDDVWVVNRDVRESAGAHIGSPSLFTDYQFKLSHPVIPVVSAFGPRQHLSIVFSWKSLQNSFAGDAGFSESSASREEALLTPSTSSASERLSPWQSRSITASRIGIANSELPLSALVQYHSAFNITHHVPSLCRAQLLSIIRRPPQFGRSVFLSTVSDSLDVVSSYPRKEPWPNHVARSRPLFNFNSGVILYLDMGHLKSGSYEDLEAQTVSLVRSAAAHFLDEYQGYINLTEEERTEVLSENHLFSVLQSTMRLVIRAHPEAFTYICIDNYTAPYERAPRSDDWPQITKILNRSLFRELRALIASGLIDSGILVGSSEMDGDPMALLTYKKEVDEWGNDFFNPGVAPTPIPFVGELTDYAADRTHDPDLQTAIGLTQERIMALGRAVLGDEARAIALWERVSNEVPSRTFTESPNAEHMWATGMVLGILRNMDGPRATKESHSEKTDGFVAS